MEALTEKISEIYQRFESVNFKEDIKKELRIINDYAKALDDGALLIAIVGDIKAGKSTFCNILANQSICQTDSQECTARPMLITKGFDKYKTYKSVGNTNDKKVLFEQILSGIIRNTSEGIEGVDMQESDITEDCKVDSNKNPDYFLTSFSVSSSELVSDKVVFADMPGLNGSKFQFDWFHETLLSRADYILFVLNSTSDISDTDKVVFNKIYEYNEDVMISIVVNLFDKSSYDEDDNSIAEAQKKLEDKQNEPIFSRFKYLRKDLSTVINLGILETYRRKRVKANRLEDAENEYLNLKHYIRQLTDNVINKSDEIRKPHIEKNIKKRIQNLIQKIGNTITDYDNQIKKYNQFQEQSSKVPDLIRHNLCKDNSTTWRVDIEKLFNISVPSTHTMIRYGAVKDKIREYNEMMKKEIIFLFQKKIQSIAKEITDEINKNVKALNTDLSNSIQLNCDIKPQQLSIPEGNDCIEYIRDKFTTIKDLIDPQYFWILSTLGVSLLCYGEGRVRNKGIDAQKIIIGEPGNKSAQIELFEKNLNDFIQDNYSRYVDELSEKIQQNMEKKCKQKSDGIISNYEDFVNVKGQLIELKNALEIIVNSIIDK